MASRKTLPTEASTVDLVGDLYDSVVEPERWPGTWRVLSGLVPASQVIYGAFDPASGRFSFFETLRWLPEYAELFTSRFAVPETNPLVRYALTKPPGEPIFFDEAAAPRELVHTEFYQELLRPLDYHHVLAINLVREEGLQALYSLYRPRRASPFEPTDFDRLQPLIPHLRRVAQLRVRLQAAAARCGEVLSVLERLDFGLLLFDRRGAVVHQNGEARRLTAPGQGLTVRKSTLHAVADAEDRVLQRLISEVLCTGARRGISSGGELLVRGDGGPLRLLITPLGSDAARWEVRGVVGGVMVFDPSRASSLTRDSLRELYDLTRAESAVVVALVGGLDTRQTAASLGVEFSTVRSQLYRAMEKIGVRSQPELLRTVLASFLGGGAASRPSRR